MATAKSFNQNVHFKAWAVLLIGIVLGVLGYYFYLHAHAAGTIHAHECTGAGGSIVNGAAGKSLCVGGGFDGEVIKGY